VPVKDAKARETRRCRYCKAVFEVDPKFVHKQFCKESHRKLYWKYGAWSVGKIAERTLRDAQKLMEAEIAPLRARVEALERWRDGVERGTMHEVLLIPMAGSERTA